MKAFANIEGIPPPFSRYASGKQEVGASTGKRRKSGVSETANRKATVHRERVETSTERLEANLVGVTVDTVGPSSLSSGINTVDLIIMQNPIDQGDTAVPAETVMASNAPDLMTINGPNLNRTFTARRKVAKRSESWYHKPPLQNIAAPLPLSPQAVIPARKKQRLEEPLPTTRDEDARKTASPDVSVGLPLATADDDDDDANEESVTDTQPNAGATGASRHWTPEEDTKLTSAVTNTCKKIWGKEYKIDWIAVAALVPGRTQGQCQSRWRYALDPSIDQMNGSEGKWIADEVKKLKDAVEKHGVNNWAAIVLLVPGRTQKQCNSRWRDNLEPSIDQMNGRTCKWRAECSTNARWQGLGRNCPAGSRSNAKTVLK
jgi:hypothetical protein